MSRAMIAGLVALAAACGGAAPADGDAGLDGGDDACAASALSLDDFFRCRGRLTCARLEDCFATDPRVLDCDGLSHAQLGTFAVERRLIEEAIAAGRARWDPVQAATCLAAIAAPGCALVKLPTAERMACTGAVGTVGDREPCASAIDCATPGARCSFVLEGRGPGGGCGFACVPPAATGDACASGSGCAPGDHCVGAPGEEVCRTGSAASPCDLHRDCDFGLQCVHEPVSGAGQCQPGLPAGAACVSDRACAGELMCVGEQVNLAGRCADLRTPAAQCDDRTGFLCFAHQYCRPVGDTLGVCVDAPSIGDPCGVVDGLPALCGFDAACDDGRCVAFRGLGEPCLAFEGTSGALACTRGLFCDAALTGAPMGRCRVLQADGEQCRAPDHCASGVCSDPFNGVCRSPLTCPF